MCVCVSVYCTMAVRLFVLFVCSFVCSPINSYCSVSQSLCLTCVSFFQQDVKESEHKSQQRTHCDDSTAVVVAALCLFIGIAANFPEYCTKSGLIIEGSAVKTWQVVFDEFVDYTCMRCNIQLRLLWFKNFFEKNQFPRSCSKITTSLFHGTLYGNWLIFPKLTASSWK